MSNAQPVMSSCVYNGDLLQQGIGRDCAGTGQRQTTHDGSMNICTQTVIP